MLNLRQNVGLALEPSAGDGAFFNFLKEPKIGYEIDSHVAPAGVEVGDFFDKPLSSSITTVVGNPPYVRYQDISGKTRSAIGKSALDGRTNLYLYFIERLLNELSQGAEIIFITPRDFLKATSSAPLNSLLWERGSFTHFLELGDTRVFEGASPNVAIWRYQIGRESKRVLYRDISDLPDRNLTLNDFSWEERVFQAHEGQIFFLRETHPLRFDELFFVKVGAVSGADDVFESTEFGTHDFVYSKTQSSGQTRKMIFNEYHPSLEPHRDRLRNRRIRKFDDSNWWKWGRGLFVSEAPRIYVNSKTRSDKPFFLHPCNYYDGSVLAIFPKNPGAKLQDLAEELNKVDWKELGFLLDGRFLFNQRSLEKTLLPATFKRYCRPEAQISDLTSEMLF